PRGFDSKAKPRRRWASPSAARVSPHPGQGQPVCSRKTQCQKGSRATGTKRATRSPITPARPSAWSTVKRRSRGVQSRVIGFLERPPAAARHVADQAGNGRREEEEQSTTAAEDDEHGQEHDAGGFPVAGLLKAGDAEDVQHHAVNPGEEPHTRNDAEQRG